MAKNRTSLPEPGILSELLSFLFPVRCVHCGTGGNWLCPCCANQLEPIGPLSCRRCGRPGRISPAIRPGSALIFSNQAAGDVCPECQGLSPGFTRARAAFRFKGPVRGLVHRLKYSGQRRLAGFMAELSVPTAAIFLADPDGSAPSRVVPGFTAPAAGCLTANCRGVTLTYVPLYVTKQVGRGYNQSEMYAKALARRLGLRHRSLLYKKQPTPAQNQLDFSERRSNLAGSFDIRRGAGMAGERVILVDDVYTTGSTASECARVLKQGLGVEVYVWTFARTVRGLSRPNQKSKGIPET